MCAYVHKYMHTHICVRTFIHTYTNVEGSEAVCCKILHTYMCVCTVCILHTYNAIGWLAVSGLVLECTYVDTVMCPVIGKVYY